MNENNHEVLWYVLPKDSLTKTFVSCLTTGSLNSSAVKVTVRGKKCRMYKCSWNIVQTFMRSQGKFVLCFEVWKRKGCRGKWEKHVKENHMCRNAARKSRKMRVENSKKNLVSH